jgi:hypothetical protein
VPLFWHLLQTILRLQLGLQYQPFCAQLLRLLLWPLLLLPPVGAALQWQSQPAQPFPDRPRLVPMPPLH